MSTNARTFYIENLGCAKNQVDAEVMISALAESGWQRSGDPADAEVIVVNSCGFIEPAKQESIDVTLQLAAQYPAAQIVMAGCLSQRYARELAEEMEEVAVLVGNRAPHRIAEFLAENQHTGRRVFLPQGTLAAHPRRDLLSLPGSAFLKVAEGCDNRCSFCAIPQIRGRMRSKPLPQVLDEASELLARGVKELNLVAQDLAAYGRGLPETGPLDLLTRLSDLPLEKWIRLLYVYPDRFPREIFPLLRDRPSILPYFDIPMQHASRKVLRRMGRPGTADSYLELIREIRRELPDAVIRSTFLVGFFDEDQAAFDELLAFQDAAEIDWLGVFPYSPEEGTPAMRSGALPEVTPKEAERRAKAIMQRQQEITCRRMDRFVGADLTVLVEELVPEEPLALGRCYAQAPEVDGSVVINVPEERSGEIVPGEFVACRIVRRNGLDLEAVPR